MTTPVRQTEAAVETQAPAAPLPVAAPLGWWISMAGAVGLLVASWMGYPTDADGMWASYRATIFGTVAVMALLALRVDLPKVPFLAIAGLAGLLQLIWGVVGEDPTLIVVTEIVGGAVILLGAALAASSPKDLSA